MAKNLLTTQELLSAPTGIDWNTIAEDAGSTSPEQAIEEANVIARATGWVNGYLGQSVNATTDTEIALLSRSGTSKCWVGPEGYMWFRTNYFPVLSISSMTWAIASAGIGSPTTNALTTANLRIYGEDFRLNRVIDRSQDWTWLAYAPGEITLTYVNGWPNAVLTGAAVTGSNVTLAVDSTLGMSITAGAIGNSLTVYDAANTETVTVTAIVDATHVTVASLANNHGIGVGVSAIPPEIKEACILACMQFARARGSETVELGQPGITGRTGDVLADAEYLLAPYIRIL